MEMTFNLFKILVLANSISVHEIFSRYHYYVISGVHPDNTQYLQTCRMHKHKNINYQYHYYS